MWFINPLVDGKEIYFCEGEHAIILKYNIATNQIDFVSQIPNEGLYGFMRYNVSVRYGDKILCVPQYGDYLYTYDLKSKEWCKICEEKADVDGKGKYVSALLIKKYAVLIPWHQKRVLVYDFETNKVGYIDGWYEKICDQSNENDIFAGDYCTYNDSAYLPFCDYPAVLRIHPETMQCEVINIDFESRKKSGFSGCAIRDGYMYLCSRYSKQLYKYDMENHTADIFNDFPKKFKGGEKVFSDILYQNNAIWAFPDEANMILKHDDISNKTSSVFVPDLTDSKDVIKSNDSFTAYKPFVIDNNHIALLVPGYEYIYSIDTRDGSSEKHPLQSEISSKMLEQINEEIMHEDKLTTLNLFLNII